MKFDWYQTTIEDNPSVVIETLAKLGHEVRPNDGIAKAYRYRQGFEVHHNQRGIVATVVMGGNGKYPHAWASSDEAPAFADLVRTEWDGKHLVTRVDAAEDFVEPGGYDRLRKVCRKVAKGHRLKFRQQVDDLNPTAGRTQYIGSNKSDYLGRLYEKGFEVLGKIPITAGCRLIPEFVINESSGQSVKLADWTRLEIQARPKQEEARRLASVASPEQIWTFTDWTQELARDALALDLERFFIRSRKVSKDEEALRWMCRQYARMLLRLKDDLGDWDCVGREIGEIIHQEHSSATGGVTA